MLQTQHNSYGPRRRLESLPRFTLIALCAMTMLILLWLALAISLQSVRFVLLSPEAYTGADAASVLSRFFGALVLLLLPVSRQGPRLRWVAAGFIVLGLGGLLFSIAWPPLFGRLAPNHSMFAAIAVWSVAGALFVIALSPYPLARRTRRIIASAVVAGVVVLGALLVVLDALPNLVTVTDLDPSFLREDAPLRGLTWWHWGLSSVPLVLSLLAAAFAVYHYLRAALGAWLVFAMLLLAGSQLHNLFWPSSYDPVLTTSDVLRLLFAATVLIGGVIELRHVAAERERLLAAEQEYSARLTELARLKNTFTAIVAHELRSPLIAVRSLAATLAYPELDPDQRSRAIATIEQQIERLSTLVRDVEDISAIDRSSFDVRIQPVPLATILENIEPFARTLSQDHAVLVSLPPHVLVRADCERIEQVLRNLVSNAVRYSPPGARIEVRAAVNGTQARIEVEDEGSGIPEQDLDRIFERFRRGSDPHAMTVKGSGLGLYLSRTIVEAHDSTLQVTSQPGVGSVFSFELEVVT